MRWNPGLVTWMVLTVWRESIASGSGLKPCAVVPTRNWMVADPDAHPAPSRDALRNYPIGDVERQRLPEIAAAEIAPAADSTDRCSDRHRSELAISLSQWGNSGGIGGIIPPTVVAFEPYCSPMIGLGRLSSHAVIGPSAISGKPGREPDGRDGCGPMSSEGSAH